MKVGSTNEELVADKFNKEGEIEEFIIVKQKARKEKERENKQQTNVFQTQNSISGLSSVFYLVVCYFVLA